MKVTRTCAKCKLVKSLPVVAVESPQEDGEYAKLYTHKICDECRPTVTYENYEQHKEFLGLTF